MQTLKQDAVWGKITDSGAGNNPLITFTLRALSGATNGSDVFYASTAPASGDMLLYYDGVLKSTNSGHPDNGASQISSGKLYSLVLTAAEMQHERIDIVISKVASFRDMHIQIRTIQRLGQIVVDASNTGLVGDALVLTAGAAKKSINANLDVAIGGALSVTGAASFGSSSFGNTTIGTLGAGAVTLSSGISLTGNFSISGNLAVGGYISGILSSMVAHTGVAQTNVTTTQIILDSSASGVDDFYKGCIVLIPAGALAAIGQTRVITAYNGTTKVATVSRAFSAAPTAGDTFILLPGNDMWSFATAAELESADLIWTPSYGVMIQALYERIFFKHTQTTALLSLYKRDNTNTWATAAVDDDGVTETVAASAHS